MPNRSILAMFAAALAAAPLAAQAQDKKAGPPVAAAQAGQHGLSARAESLHAQCIGCHGLPGYKTAFPEVYHVPKIAGQQQAYIVNALKAYKSGERSHPSMRGIAASLTEEDMAALAAYYGAAAK